MANYYHHPERVIHHPALTLKYVRPARRPGLRVVVGVKTASKATQRNLLKRRLREVWRAAAVPPDVMATIYTSKATLDLSFTDLKKIIINFVRQFT